MSSATPTRDFSTAHEVIEPRDGHVRFVVVADSHGRPHPDAAARIAAERPHAIIHAGDIGDLSVLTALGTIARLLAVRGNIDVRAERIPDALTIAIAIPERAPLRLLVVHIGVLGLRLRSDVAAFARKEGAALVVCGHSHVPFIGRDEGLGVFNPGSIGPRRFALPIVFGIMDIDANGVRMRHVDCETGKTWTP